MATVLVVEDGDSVRRLICDMLLMHGFHVMESRDGLEALELCREKKDSIHLVLTDVIMPRMNGGQLARELTECCPDLRVVFMSGYTGDALEAELGKVRARFLYKPFTSLSLVATVREALEQ